MISKIEFLKIWEPLMNRFQPPSDEQLDIDYERLNVYEPEILKKAVEIILETRSALIYPPLGEIFDALEQAYALRRSAEKADSYEHIPDCQQCYDSGVVYHYPNLENKATFCSCLKGRKKRAAWIEYRHSHDIGKTRRAYEEAS